jgi:hypothetical protein
MINTAFFLKRVWGGKGCARSLRCPTDKAVVPLKAGLHLVTKQKHNGVVSTSSQMFLDLVPFAGKKATQTGLL